MRGVWIYRFGSFACFVSAGVAIVIDAQYSYKWVEATIGINSMVAMGISIIISTVSTSVGALLTHSTVWALILNDTLNDIIEVKEELDKGLRLFGLCLQSTFLFGMIGAAYGLNIYSSYCALRVFTDFLNSLIGSVLLCFASDTCLVFNWLLWIMAKDAKVTRDKINERIKPRVRR
ncbi:MAG: hypothetical protein AB4352_21175 [Hormoscilla sp.]